MKRHQQGAALIIVLVLLSVSLVIGMSGMNAALVDERLAGNYRAASQAQMNSEKAVSQAIQEFYKGQESGENSWVNARSISSVENAGDIFEEENVKMACDEEMNKCAYEFLLIDDVYSILAKGAVVSEKDEELVSVSSFIRVEFEQSFSGDDEGDNDEVSDKEVASLLEKIKNSGDLINVLSDYEFSSSNNAKAKGWEDKISKDNTLFDTPEQACLFKDALISGEVAKGLVEVVSGNVNGKDFSGLSGNIVVVENDGFSLPNASDFRGVVMVFGRDFNVTGGGNIAFSGAVVHVPVDCGGQDFGTPYIDVRGGNGDYDFSEIESIIERLDIDDEELPEDGGNGFSNNNDLRIFDWQWSFE